MCCGRRRQAGCRSRSRSVRQLTRLGDLAVAEPANFLQQEHLAIVLTECSERGIQFSREAEVAIAGHVRQLDERRTPQRGTHVIARQVSCDLEQPGTLAAVGVVATAQRAQESLLRQVLGDGTVTQQAPEEPSDPLIEGRAFACGKRWSPPPTHRTCRGVSSSCARERSRCSSRGEYPSRHRSSAVSLALIPTDPLRSRVTANWRGGLSVARERARCRSSRARSAPYRT